MKVNIKHVKDFVNLKEAGLQDKINKIHESIHQKEKPSDFLGWLDLPNNIEQTEINKIETIAQNLKNKIDVLVVIGIGGSYAGSKAGIEFLDQPFNNDNVEVVYAGHNISGRYLKDLLKYLENKRFAINVISKSGTTTEPAIAFRILKKVLMDKLGKDYKDYIVATTDGEKGSLYELSKQEGFEMFVIPNDIGGRFSVLTAVGLFPFAVKGYNIKEMIEGAKDIMNASKTPNIEENDAYLYAALRYLLYKSGKKIEILVNYEPNLIMLSEWWKQLYGESEGKDSKGLFVASANFSTDLHSLGQYIQDGERHLFETVLNIKTIKEDVVIEPEENDLDKLNYLSGKTLKYVNDKALEGTMLAHVSGNVPNILIDIEDISERSFGKIVYFFELACAISAYLIEVDPFDQPGVETYKTNMFALLGKKGYENIL